MSEQRETIRKLQAENRKLKSIKHQQKVASKLLSGVLTEPQIRMMTTPGLRRVKKWTEEDILQALVLRRASKKAYSYLRRKKLLPLPGLSTLRKWIHHVKCVLGIQLEAMSVLEAQVGEKKSIPLYNVASIAFDEMYLSKKYSYSSRQDQVFKADTVQVVMVRGLFHNWKQPIFYDFDQPMTKKLLFEIIEKLEDIGVQIWSITCDCGPTNQGLLKSLKVTHTTTTFSNPVDDSREVFCFLDPPHLLKLIRNHVIDKDVHIDKDHVINRTYFQKILTVDSAEYKINHKLSDKHITCNRSERQNVRLAAQLLSNSVSCAIDTVDPTKHVQAIWVKQVNDWFDVCNSRKKFDKVPNRCGFGIKFSEQKKSLKQIIKTMMAMRVGDHKNMIQFQKGVLITSKSLLALFTKLRQLYPNIDYLPTSHLNQDMVESFFSCIRALGSEHTHPTAVEFMDRFRYLLLGKGSSSLLDKKGLNVETSSEENEIDNGVLISNYVLSKTSEKEQPDPHDQDIEM